MGKIPGSTEDFLKMLVIDIKFNREGTMLEEKHENITKIQAS